MDRKLLRQLLEKYEAGTCSEEERELLHRFFNAFQHENAFTGDHESEIRADIFARLNDRINEEEDIPSGGFRWRMAMSVVIALALAATFFFYQYNQPEEFLSISTQNGERMTVTLPDGSVVMLNAGTTLSYPERFTKRREVKLAGEAFFEVTSNPERPFTVETGAMTTRVLGTSFNVNAYDFQDEIKVTVVTGRVQVATASQRLELNPGEQASYTVNHDSLEMQVVDAGAWVAWTEGALRFDGASLREIMEVLERWYGVEISMDAVVSDKCDLRMTFQDLSLFQVLDQLKRVTGIDYAITGEKQILISGVGCKP